MPKKTSKKKTEPVAKTDSKKKKVKPSVTVDSKVKFKDTAKKSIDLQPAARNFAKAIGNIPLEVTFAKVIKGKTIIKVGGSHFAWDIKYFEIIK